MPGGRDPPLFVGRARELQLLGAALTAAAGGCLSTVVVGGESGVGKSRLVTEFVARASAEGARVLAGRCLELETGPPLWPVLHPLRAVLGNEERPSDQTHLFDLVANCYSEMANPGPLVVVVEDLHWADHSTCDLLTFLHAYATHERILFVLTYRGDGGRRHHRLVGFLAELRRAHRAEFLVLAPFDRDELALYLTGILRSTPTDEHVEEIRERSNGNAFYAAELATAGPASGLSPTLEAVVQGRLTQLSPTALEVTRITAAGLVPVGHGLLAAVAGLDDERLLPALRECISGGILVADDGTYTFRHGLVREVVCDELLPGDKVRLHAAYAELLEHQPDLGTEVTPGLVAQHWIIAGDRARALRAAVLAGDGAEAAYGYAEANRHYEQALELWNQPGEPPAGVPAWAVIVSRAARAAHLAGSPERAVALMEGAMSTEPAETAGLRPDLGRYLLATGNVARALATYEQALDVGDTRPAVVAAHAEALLLAGRYQEALRRVEEGLGRTRRSGTGTGSRAGPEEARLLSALGFALAHVGSPDASLAAGREALTVAEKAGDADALGRAWVNLAELLSGPLHRLEEAVDVACDGIRRLPGLDRSHGAALGATAANALFRMGQWERADPILRAAFARRPTGAAAAELHLARARLAVARGSHGEADTDLDVVERIAGPASRFGAPLLTLRAGLALWRDQPSEARRYVEMGLDLLEGSEDSGLVAPLLWHGLRAEADLRPGDVRSGKTAVLLRRAQRLLPEDGPALDRAYRALCQAEATRVGPASDPEAWAEAAALTDELGQPYPAAYSRWREAEALLAARSDRARAVATLRSAAAVAVALGAEPFRVAVEGLARRARIKLAATDLGPAAAQGGLSRREHEVLTLVAEGRTNREVAEALFISPKTVSIHVSRVLAKLGARTRTEAGALAQRRGLLR